MEGSKANEDTDLCIMQAAETWVDHDGREHRIIGLKATTSISRAQRITPSEVEIEALRQGIIPRRYLRNTGTIGLAGQIHLLRSTVAVAGVGGLGGTIVELLAREGIGRLLIIDDDCFTEQNLNRQIMATEGNLGQPKVTVASGRVRDVNSATEVTALQERLTSDNARDLLSGACVVTDGLDNLPSRFAVEVACRHLDIPYVYGTIAGLSGQLMTIFPGDSGLSSLYGATAMSPERGAETAVGNPATTPAIMAALQVQEIVKIITGIGTPVRNQILLIDAASGTIDRLALGS